MAKQRSFYLLCQHHFGKKWYWLTNQSCEFIQLYIDTNTHIFKQLNLSSIKKSIEYDVIWKGLS